MGPNVLTGHVLLLNYILNTIFKTIIINNNKKKTAINTSSAMQPICITNVSNNSLLVGTDTSMEEELLEAKNQVTSPTHFLAYKHIVISTHSTICSTHIVNGTLLNYQTQHNDQHRLAIVQNYWPRTRINRIAHTLNCPTSSSDNDFIYGREI